jgi:hypothetical protein
MRNEANKISRIEVRGNEMRLKKRSNWYPGTNTYAWGNAAVAVAAQVEHGLPRKLHLEFAAGALPGSFRHDNHRLVARNVERFQWTTAWCDVLLFYVKVVR